MVRKLLTSLEKDILSNILHGCVGILPYLLTKLLESISIKHRHIYSIYYFSLLAISEPVAYPGGLYGCPEPPPAKIFLNQGVDTILAPTFISHLNLRNLEEKKPETNSGYATELRYTNLKSEHFLCGHCLTIFSSDIDRKTQRVWMRHSNTSTFNYGKVQSRVLHVIKFRDEGAIICPF